MVVSDKRQANVMNAGSTNISWLNAKQAVLEMVEDNILRLGKLWVYVLSIRRKLQIVVRQFIEICCIKKDCYSFQW